MIFLSCYFSDDGVGFPIQKGIVASRSKVYWFRHNDMADLEKKMVEQEERDLKVSLRNQLLAR